MLAVKAYYEDLLARLPSELTPPELRLRSRLLRDEINQGDRLLDLGCGEGQFSALAAASGALTTGADVAQAAIDRASAAPRTSASSLSRSMGRSRSRTTASRLSGPAR